MYLKTSKVLIGLFDLNCFLLGKTRDKAMTKTLTFLVEITPAVEAFATRHGAYFDRALKKWVVAGTVSPRT
jgi:hypothetical protein